MERIKGIDSKSKGSRYSQKCYSEDMLKILKYVAVALGKSNWSMYWWRNYGKLEGFGGKIN